MLFRIVTEQIISLSLLPITIPFESCQFEQHLTNANREITLKGQLKNKMRDIRNSFY